MCAVLMGNIENYTCIHSSWNLPRISKACFLAKVYFVDEDVTFSNDFAKLISTNSETGMSRVFESAGL